MVKKDRKEYKKTYYQLHKSRDYTTNCKGGLIKIAVSQLNQGWLDDNLYILLIAHNYDPDCLMNARGVDNTTRVDKKKYNNKCLNNTDVYY